MAEDRGGLQYTIKVTDNFSGGLDAFSAKIAEARREWAALKAELAKPTTSGGQSRTQELNSQAAAARRAAAAETALLSAGKPRLNQLALETAAERRRGKQIFNTLEARVRATKAVKDGFLVERASLTQSQRQAAAEQRLTRVLDRRREVADNLNAIRRQGVRLDREEQIRLGINVRNNRSILRIQEQRTRAEERLFEAKARNSDKALIAAEAERKAIDKITAAEVRRQTVERLRAQGRGPDGALIPPPPPPRLPGSAPGDGGGRPGRGPQTAEDFNRITRAAKNTDGQVNRISFTFRRLFGILAAFTAARLGAQFFFSTIRDAVRLNAELEQVELGLASLIAAAGDVRGIDGQLVGAAERLELSFAEARRQVNALRIDSLTTTATFRDLADAFQQAVAPGLQAGLSVDEVRRFARQISIAATAIGLPQNQLAEEIRSILEPSIRPTQTRIAVALGISNEDVRRARDAGELFEFLSDRFAVFEAAAERASRTFQGLSQRLIGAFQVIAQIGGEGLFERVAVLIESILDDVVTVNRLTQEIEPNPRLVAAFETIGDGISAFVDEAERLREALNLEDAQALAEAFRTIARTAASVLGGAVEGIAKGLQDAAAAVGVVRRGIQAITGVDVFDAESLGKVVQAIVRVFTVLIAINLILSGFRGPLLALIGSITALNRSLRASVASSIGLNRGLTSAATAAGAAAAGTRAVDAATGAAAASAVSFRLRIQRVLAIVSRLAAQATAIIAVAAVALTLGQALADQFKLIGLAAQAASILIRVQFNALSSLFDGFKGTIESAFKSGFGAAARVASGFFEEIANAISTTETVLNTLIKSVPGAARLLPRIDIGADQIRGLALSLDILGESTRDTEIPKPDLSGFVPDLIQNIKDEIEIFRIEANKIFADSGDGSSESFVDAFVRNFSSNLQAIRDLLNSVLPDTEQGVAERSSDEIQKSIDGIILGISTGLKQIQDEFEGVRDSLRQSADDALSFSGTERAEQSISQIVSSRERERLAALRQSSLAIRNIATFERQIAQIRRDLAAEGLDEESRRRSEGEIAALEGQISLIRQAIQELSVLRQSASAIQSLPTIRQDNIEAARAQALAEIEARRERAVFLAERERNAEAAALAETRARLETLNEQERQRLETINATRDAIRSEIALAIERIGAIRELRDATSDAAQRQDLAQTIALEGDRARELGKQLELLDQQEASLRAANAIERERLAIQRLINESAESSPFQTGFTQAFVGLFDEIPNRFQFTINTLQDIVRGFSEFVSRSIVDAFDPTAETSVQERFARFLQGIAQQVITTLVQLAITAAALNLASGGLLGPLIQNLARAQSPSGGFGFGLAEGGNVGDEAARRRGGRAPRAARPKGLSPLDTVPAWLDPKEWVINRGSVARLGSDAMDIINRGLFDPYSLRAALGLRPWKSGTVRAVTSRSLGLAEGGSVSGVSRRASSRTKSGVGGGVSVVSASQQATDRMLRAGQDALLRNLAAQGILPNA